MELHVSMNDNYQVETGKSLHNVKFRNYGNSKHHTHTHTHTTAIGRRAIIACFQSRKSLGTKNLKMMAR